MEVVGQDVQNLRPVAEALAGVIDDVCGVFELRASWQQRRTVSKGPTCVLGMSEFQPINVPLDR